MLAQYYFATREKFDSHGQPTCSVDVGGSGKKSRFRCSFIDDENNAAWAPPQALFYWGDGVAFRTVWWFCLLTHFLIHSPGPCTHSFTY